MSRDCCGDESALLGTSGDAMAKAALKLATRPEVLTLARAIDTAQTAEVIQLQQMLEARG